MTSLIIGASSNLAITLRRQLELSGETVLMLGRKTAKAKLDLESQEVQGINLLEGVSDIYICAASLESDTTDGILKNFAINTNGALSLLRLFTEVRPKRVTFAGTVFSDPRFDPSRKYSSYALSKKLCEEILSWWCRNNSISFRTIRFSQLIDSKGLCCSHQPWIGRIVGYAARQLKLKIPGSIGVRNFLHFEDAAIIMSRAHQCEPEILNGCNPNGISYQDIAIKAFELFNCIDKLENNEDKEKFREVFPPAEKTIFELLNIKPTVTIDAWLLQIRDLNSGLNFGPIDVDL